MANPSEGGEMANVEEASITFNIDPEVKQIHGTFPHVNIVVCVATK